MDRWRCYDMIAIHANDGVRMTTIINGWCRWWCRWWPGSLTGFVRELHFFFKKKKKAHPLRSQPSPSFTWDRSFPQFPRAEWEWSAADRNCMSRSEDGDGGEPGTDVPTAKEYSLAVGSTSLSEVPNGPRLQWTLRQGDGQPRANVPNCTQRHFVLQLGTFSWELPRPHFRIQHHREGGGRITGPKMLVSDAEWEKKCLGKNYVPLPLTVFCLIISSIAGWWRCFLRTVVYTLLFLVSEY